MGDRSGIEWCDATWNPVVGCSRVSEGCRHCYAERQAVRMEGNPHVTAYQGVAKSTAAGPRWTGKVNFVPERLDQPLRWTRPRRIFVNSMSDLFHEELSNEQIAAVFGVMAAARRHQFLVLTKRPKKMLEWFRWVERLNSENRPRRSWHVCIAEAAKAVDHNDLPPSGWPSWPLPNAWIGVSVEDQATADKRIPLLLQCPAAVRWVSYEPALGPVDFTRVPFAGASVDALRGARPAMPPFDWIVVGGESGPGARPFDVAWARRTIEQCQEAGVPVFVKQLGARPTLQPESSWGGSGEIVVHHPGPDEVRPHDSKGGDPAEWPEDLRVREWPA